MKDALELWDSFLLAFTALLPMINPVGSALVFLGLVGNAPLGAYRPLARRIAINNIIFLAVIELLGSAILHFFGISLPIVQVAGGLVITAIGWSVLNEKEPTGKTRDKSEEVHVGPDETFQALDQKAFYPFTFPVTSGPGTLAVTLTLAARAQGGGLRLSVLRHSALFAAILVLSLFVYICYANAPRLTRAISPSTVNGILRVVAFIVLCIGVQIAWNGLSQLAPALLNHTS